MNEAEIIALAVLKAIVAVPSIAAIVANGIAGDESPLADEVRKILPEEGASAAARRELELRNPGG